MLIRMDRFGPHSLPCIYRALRRPKYTFSVSVSVLLTTLGKTNHRLDCFLQRVKQRDPAFDGHPKTPFALPD